MLLSIVTAFPIVLAALGLHACFFGYLLVVGMPWPFLASPGLHRLHPGHVPDETRDEESIRTILARFATDDGVRDIWQVDRTDQSFLHTGRSAVSAGSPLSPPVASGRPLRSQAGNT